MGRGSVKAHCHLLVEKHKPLKQHARERLKALEEMNHLGAGFGISVKDLELRGAGNILGPQQSGHIAAVGYDMYCRLLKLTVERLAAGETTDRERPRFEETEAGCELEVVFGPSFLRPGSRRLTSASTRSEPSPRARTPRSSSSPSRGFGIATVARRRRPRSCCGSSS